MAATFEDKDWVYPRHHKKQAYIVECMSLKAGRIDDPFPRNTIFTKEQLLSLCPSDICAYCNWKAYGDPYPGPNAVPKDGRAGSVEKAKQGVGFFLPNSGVPWIEGVGGNPTRHSSVTAVIKRIQDLETKGLGVDEGIQQGRVHEGAGAISEAERL